MEPKFPGVFEYSLAAPGTLDAPEYAGCDSAGSACVGRYEYSWSVEYVTGYSWLLYVTPVDTCYSHEILMPAVSGNGTRLGGVIGFAPFVAQLNLQPTPEGFKVGSILGVGDSLLPADTGVSWSENYVPKYYQHPQLLEKVFSQALLDHLKAQTWDCTR
jgi:hypothetical protein